ncbi:MAG: ABC transporter substrate-binding protein [Oscillospiraceae bacterium]|nr:ABC transporter substrate-binding protein [Oscillospiraceae bacterium]
MKKILAKLVAFSLVASALLITGGCSNETTNDSDSIAENNSVNDTINEPATEIGNDEESNIDSDNDVDSDTENQDEEINSDDTITVIDHAGNQVTVPTEINRIVIGNILPLPSVLTVFFDNAEKIVGMSEGSMKAAENGLLGELYPEILNAETDFIDGSTINIEEVIALNPDVFFYSASEPQVGEQLEEAGIPAVAISVNKWDYNTIETLNNWIDLLSEMFPENNKAEVCRNYSNDVYHMIQEKIENIPDDKRENVFFLFQYTDSSIATSGKQFFGQFWADAIGAKNVAEGLTTDNSVTVSMEQIYEWNPSLVFITNFTSAQPDDIYHNTIGTYDWSAIQASENQRVYKMPLGMYRSYTPGVDTPITLMWLAKTAYPDIFTDIDITQETKNYYQEVFNITLTDEQAEKIFTPVSEASVY